MAVLGRDAIGDPDDKLTYAPAVLENLLEKTGFEVLDMRTDRRFNIAWLRVRWISWGPRLGSHILSTSLRV
jgi:hypothetical protein